MNLTGVTVLVVDDDPECLELLALMLGQCGANVRTEACARDAVVACDEDSFHVVVSDLSMPGADGYALLRALRLRDQCLRIPVIALTGLANHRERALEAGFDLFLVKPVDRKMLCRCVEALVK